jgi:hypothetical protein
MDSFAIDEDAAARGGTLTVPSTAPIRPTESVPSTGRRATPGGETETPPPTSRAATGPDRLGESNTELAAALVRFQRSL